MFFENAQNTTVVDSQFTAVQGDLHIHNNPQHNTSISDKKKKALAILHPHISEGALYDSAARYDQPKCLPGTRTAILNKIMDWLHGAEDEDVLMWLYGPAGTGKTTILQTIAKLSLEAQFLVACFFFGRDYLDRNNKTHLIPTLVYQLATSIPEICHYLLESLETNPAVFGQDLQTQVTHLILNPLKKVAEVSIGSLATRPIVIVVDGLDECSGSRDQQTIINVLSTAALELIPHVLIIIASRPEPPIRKAFNKQPISILSVALDNDYSSQKDIESYFGFRFSELRKDPATALPDAWPSADVIRRLVEKASGQFIFASTVMNYLESSQRHPIESLEIVLGLLRSGDDIPFAELDALYIHIFSSIPTSILPKVLDIFRFLLLSEDSEQKNTKILDPLFEFKPGEAAYALSNLHAILSVYPRLDRSFEIKLLHKSLEDFLLDKSRSGQFYIDPSLGHSMLATRWICRYQKDNNWNSAREAINHYIRGELTQDLIRGLQTFNISQHFSNVLKLEKIEAENYWTSRDEFRLNKRAFTNFYKYIKGQSCPESSEQQQIYRHFLSQFDDWILSIIERCSDEVQECYGVFIKLNVMADRVCSAEPLGLNNLDEKILFPMLDEFFSDETRSKKHFVDEFKYASIASKWACHKFVPKLPNDFKQIYQHVDYRLRFLVDLTNCLPLSAANVGLAILLLEKTLRFSREATFPKERWRLGVASLDYIKRCNVTISKCRDHGGQICVICTKVQGRAYDRKVQWHDEDVLVFFSPPPSP